jgi:glutathione peroxidase
MIKIALFLCLALALSSNALAADAAKPKSVHDFTVKDIDGKSVDLSKYKGKVLLIVNTASKCGYTPQYTNLEKLYDQYKEKGLEVLAFPANEFKSQEPGTNAEIKEFCTSKYDVSFPLFSKIVVKGEGQAPLYQYLTSTDANQNTAGDIKWNFTKFLVSKDGRIVARYEPKVKPDDKEVIDAIEKELAKG